MKQSQYMTTIFNIPTMIKHDNSKKHTRTIHDENYEGDDHELVGPN